MQAPAWVPDWPRGQQAACSYACSAGARLATWCDTKAASPHSCKRLATPLLGGIGYEPRTNPRMRGTATESCASTLTASGYHAESSTRRVGRFSVETAPLIRGVWERLPRGSAWRVPQNPKRGAPKETWRRAEPDTGTSGLSPCHARRCGQSPLCRPAKARLVHPRACVRERALAASPSARRRLSLKGAQEHSGSTANDVSKTGATFPVGHLRIHLGRPHWYRRRRCRRCRRRQELDDGWTVLATRSSMP